MHHRLYYYIFFLCTVVLSTFCSRYGGDEGCYDPHRFYYYLPDSVSNLLPAQPASLVNFKVTNDSPSYAQAYRFGSSMKFFHLIRRDGECRHFYREEMRHLYRATGDTTGEKTFSYSIGAMPVNYPFPASFLLRVNDIIYDEHAAFFEKSDSDTLNFTLHTSYAYGSKKLNEPSDSVRVSYSRTLGILNLNFYNTGEIWEREF